MRNCGSKHLLSSRCRQGVQKQSLRMTSRCQALLEAVAAIVREKNMRLLKEGTIFIDDADYGIEPRLLFYIEDCIQDGIKLESGAFRTVSKQMHFVEMKEDGSVKSAGYAPYLDYSSPNEEQRKTLLDYAVKQNWLKENVEEKARVFATSVLTKEHFEKVKAQRRAIAEKTLKEVNERLKSEIMYWDARAAELKLDEETGKSTSKINHTICMKRADELAIRLTKRQAELEMEKAVFLKPPVIIGGALIIPRGLVDKLTGRDKPSDFSINDRKSIEMTAMNAVMRIERSLGCEPRDVSAEKVGYDIESRVLSAKEDEPIFNFIEVKGRISGAETITVSKNEILTALNKPEQFILAVVEVGKDDCKVYYFKEPFTQKPDMTVTSVNYSLEALKAQAKIVLERKLEL